MGINETDLTNAPGWRPEPGDSIIGKVVGIDQGWSDEGNDYYPILTIQPAKGDAVSVHCFHQILKAKVLGSRPQVGAEIGIKFEGKVDTKDGRRQVAVYAVRIDGGTADPYAGMVAPERTSTPSTPDNVPGPDTDDIPF